MDHWLSPRHLHLDWHRFFEDASGDELLQLVREQWRKDYDYVLIDSRTGLADTAGICTVALPDEVVLCFTLNEQSIEGCEAIAHSIAEQRRGKFGQSTIKLWPIATRIELAERDKLEAARDRVQRAFSDHLIHLTRDERRNYWAEAEVPYPAYFAYEEILAVLVEQSGSALSVVPAYLNLARRLAPQMSIAPFEVSREERDALVARYLRERPVEQGHYDIAISRTSQGPGIATELAARLAAEVDQREQATMVWVTDDVPLGANVKAAFEAKLSSLGVLIVVLDGSDGLSPWQEWEIETAIANKIAIVPMLPAQAVDSPPIERPDLLSDYRFAKWDDCPPEFIEQLADLAAPRPTDTFASVDDPHRNRWGGEPRTRGRELTAVATAVAENWFEVTVTLARASGGNALRDDVVFFCHPRIEPSMQTVTPTDDQASITFQTFGAFTVGATADSGTTRLELDLSKIDDAPEAFKLH